MKLVQPLSFLLLAAASGPAAAASAKVDAPSEYEPNNAPRLTKTIRRNANNGNNVRKLSKSGGADATDGTGKSSKSGASDDGILEFLDPNGTTCPCFTTAMINEAWAAFQDQNPGAECAIEDGTDFLAIETTMGSPPFEFSAGTFIEDDGPGRRLANGAHAQRGEYKGEKAPNEHADDDVRLLEGKSDRLAQVGLQFENRSVASGYAYDADRTWQDNYFATCFCDPNGRLVAQGLTLPGHLGSVPTALRAVLDRYGNAVREGDIFCLNDPYEGGMHLPDLFIVQPIDGLSYWRAL